MELQHIEQALPQRLLNLVLQFIHKYAHLDHERRQGITNIGRVAHVDASRTFRIKNESERIRAEFYRQQRVIQVRRPADFNLGIHLPSNSFTFAAMSPLRINDSPTRMAFTPAFATRSTSARAWMPLSATNVCLPHIPRF